jgi:hypothetical protein
MGEVHPELEQYRQQFEEISSQARDLTAGLSEAQFNWRPAPATWSIQECLAHLTMVGQVEADAIEAAVTKAREISLTGAGPFEYPAWERYILRETEPPVRHPRQSPKHFVPVHEQPITGILPTFLHVQSRFLLQIERADGLDLRRVKVATPITSLIKLSLGTTLAQAAAHERRHMEQARKVRARLG